MNMPPRKIIEQVIELAHNHGMPLSGAADTEGLPENVARFLKKMAEHGVPSATVRIAQIDATGHRLPQDTPLHIVDTTAMEVPPVVEHWKLESLDETIADLCLVGVVMRAATPFPAARITVPPHTIAVFQVCEHGKKCPKRPHGPTDDIGSKNINRTKRQRYTLEYFVLLLEDNGKKICTLLSLQSTHWKRWEGVTAVLMINPNRIQQEYSL